MIDKATLKDLAAISGCLFALGIVALAFLGTALIVVLAVLEAFGVF